MSRSGPRAIACDVLVVGSGAAGLAAAVTAAAHGLKVVVAEKTAHVGGTSAWSGGWLWIPMNPLARKAGIVEEIDAPLAYLRSEIGNRAGDPRIAAYLRNGPEMVEFFAANTDVVWIDGNRIPDFHPTPGARSGGRSVCAAPFDGRRLGPWLARLRPPLGIVSLAGMGIASGADMAHFFKATRAPRSALHVARRLVRHARDMLTAGRSTQLVNGNALVARLLASAVARDVDILTGAPAVALIAKDGRVTGARLQRGGVSVEVSARRGVVLAAGGFPHDRARIAALFPHAADGSGHHSAAPATNTGDGLRLGEQAGGRVATDLADPAAWAPVSLVPLGPGETGHFPHLVERAKPGIIAVGADGRRFVNEADSYHDFMRALFRTAPAGQTPHAWLIADHRALRRWGLGWVKPFPFPLRGALARGYLKRGRTVAGLAAACGLPADALAETLARFNRQAAQGEDGDFGRGRSPYNRAQGDPDHRPTPSLAPLDRPPYYAVKVVPGSLGTFAGLETDAMARVLDAAGRPLPGLYAAGNDMASIFGGNYPSGGITLGPAMTFGYIAGRALAGLPVTGVDAPATTDAKERT